MRIIFLFGSGRRPWLGNPCFVRVKSVDDVFRSGKLPARYSAAFCYASVSDHSPSCPVQPAGLAVYFRRGGGLCRAGVIGLRTHSLLAGNCRTRPSRISSSFLVHQRAVGDSTAAFCSKQCIACAANGSVHFRRSLIGALVAGTLFVGVQSYGLKCLMRNQVADETQTGANAFIAIMVALHAMHLSLALLFLIWVTLNALADRYDHEYFWGVRVCAWFWHGLGNRVDAAF